MKYLNLVIPTSWSELSQDQLFYLFNLIAAGYNSVEVCTNALMKWNDITVLDPIEPGLHRILKDGEMLRVRSTSIAEVLFEMRWMTELPSCPIRLDMIKGRHALPADLQGVELEKFIMCDNLYQGYLETKRSELLQEMAMILYDVPRGEEVSFTLTSAQEINIFYWWAGLKRYFSNLFPNILKVVDADDSSVEGASRTGLGKSSFRKLQDSMNNMIRALTKGDVTKEKEVLAIDVWRAFTELDAQAREYDEMEREIHRR